MRALEAKAARIGRVREERAAERLATEAAAVLPGDVEVARDGAALTLSASGLRRRMIGDARLRGLGWLAAAVRG